MDNKPLITDDKRYNDENTGKFIEDNPGRPKGVKNKFSIAMLEKAIEAEEQFADKENEPGIFQKFVRMAYTNPGVMIALMKKFVPDKEKIEHDIPEGRKITIEHIGSKSKGN